MVSMPQKNASEAGTAAEAVSQARVVIDDHGRIVFATPDFSELSGISSDALRGQPLTGIMTFSDPEEAFHAQKMFGSGASETSDAAAMIRSLREGIHPVLFGTRAAELQFDRVRMKDGRSFVVDRKSVV